MGCHQPKARTADPSTHPPQQSPVSLRCSPHTPVQPARMSRFSSTCTYTHCTRAHGRTDQTALACGLSDGFFTLSCADGTRLHNGPTLAATGGIEILAMLDGSRLGGCFQAVWGCRHLFTLRAPSSHRRLTPFASPAQLCGGGRRRHPTHAACEEGGHLERGGRRFCNGARVQRPCVGCASAPRPVGVEERQSVDEAPSSQLVLSSPVPTPSCPVSWWQQ